MKRSSILTGRLSGLVTMVGGLLWAVGGITALNYDSIGITMRGPHIVLTAGGLLSLIGLTRLARYQALDYGRFGKAGVIIASAGVILIIASKNMPSTTPDETGWNVFYLGGFLLVIGSLLFGGVVSRKLLFLGGPFLAIGLLGVANMVFLMGSFKVTEYKYVGTMLLPTLIGFSWIFLGYAIWSYEAKTRDGTHLDGTGKAIDPPFFPVMNTLKKN